MGNISPAETLVSMLMGNSAVQIIGIAAELGIADLLKNGPLHSDEIAVLCNTKPHPTYRILRSMSNVGIIEEGLDKKFSITPMGEFLIKDKLGSFNALARLTSSEWMAKGFNNLMYTLKTGESAFEKAHGTDIFSWLSNHPEENVIFQHAMSTFSGMEVEFILNVYDFSKIKCVVDVGGGVGVLITNILKKYPDLKGKLFDVPDVKINAVELIEKENLSDRCEFISGSFFDSVPTGGDMYILKHILHDWNDQKSLQILNNISSVMKKGDCLLVMEQGIAPPGVPCAGKTMDIGMMALTDGGMERSREEHSALFDSANIEFVRCIDIPGPISIFEGIKR